MPEQLTFRYEDGKPVGIDAVVLYRTGKALLSDLQEAVMEEIIKPVLPAAWCDANTKCFGNDRPVLVRGPHGDWPDRTQDHRRYLWRHGAPRRRRLLRQGPFKVDRSAAYLARYVAKTSSRPASLNAGNSSCPTPSVGRTDVDQH